MAIRIGSILSLTLAGASLLSAQEGRVSGPNAGFVFDTVGHVLRPVRGIAGASVIGDPVDLGMDVANVYIAPQQDAALAAAADGSLHFFGLAAGIAKERPVEGLSGTPERVVFSPNGTAVALYAAGRVQVIRGLPDSPSVSNALDAGGTSAGLAVSDDGLYVLSAGTGTLRLLGVSGDQLKLMDVADGAMAAFGPHSYDVAVSDPLGAGLLLFRDPLGSFQKISLASGDNAVASPVGLAFSADARKLFVASTSARSVASFDLASGDRADIACSCAPAGLVRMGSLFRLNDLGTDPLWLLDSLAEVPRTVFVPALAPPGSVQ